MSVFYITLIITFILAFLARIMKQKNNKISNVFVFFIIILLVIVAGNQTNIGDTPQYMTIYRKLVVNPASVDLNYDGGFTFFMIILTKISKDPQILIIISAIIINLINIKMFLKYESLLEIQLFLYIASGYYIVTMNGIRQCMVAAVFLYSTKYIEQGKFLKYCIITFILSMFHQSAFIMIPVYFILRCKPWSKLTFAIIGGSIVTVLSINKFLPLLFEVLKGTNYSHYETYISAGNGGANVMRIAIAAVPVVLAYIKRDILAEKWKSSGIFVNAALLNIVFFIFSTVNWIFARFNIYFQMYTFILLAYLIKECFPKKEKRLLYFSCIVFYFIVFWYEYDKLMNLQYVWNSNWFNIFGN
ncbi:EpsG family protein [Clostridium perfringens]|uniref:EpsG family protein n=1 Tax=Clostridium perfringens TaxID=1502 RepID=UPI0018E4362D|nr:EpsG family protein [Clostridium perfringens]MBI6091450.1 EpsG family protein [Clostridium perfringens]MDM1000228.1 EpsG family protein [Clostridium perfringens]MDU3642840.1 EpsG family protein [Clostridium perfringens]MDZ4983567.1 EpsG family protein [Clostridium perfringens]UBL04240.1 EpsG family protein [Clostridium perfringens]